MSSAIENNIIIVDDDKDFAASLVQMLEVEDYNVKSFHDPALALKAISPDFDGVVIMDVRMPRHSGEDVLKILQKMDQTLPVILVTGHGDIPMAVRSLKEGAYGFFTKPLQVEEFLNDIKRAHETRAVELERRKLARQLEMRDDLLHLVSGTAPSMVQLRKLIIKVGSADVDVLIQGETGSGKEVVATALTRVSARAERPFVAVNCGNISSETGSEQLFGVVNTLPNGDTQLIQGRFEKANHGTLLLDEIESLPLPIQVKLLRVLQERKLERVNSMDEIELDLRVLATTKADLATLVEQGLFRQDLFYRLNGVTISIPPLRDRGADPVILFEQFLNQRTDINDNYKVTTDEMSELMSHDWPGNVRELINVTERFAAGLSLFGQSDKRSRADSLSARVANFEKGLIE